MENKPKLGFRTEPEENFESTRFKAGGAQEKGHGEALRCCRAQAPRPNNMRLHRVLVSQVA